MSSATLKKSAMHLNLDRSAWKLVRFGDVAVKQNESVDRQTTELKRYIAGEHMRSEDLHLRERGEVGEDYLGPAFTRKFVEGDILYGSRRTYLRKVAVAHFDGITANTTFVIKANEELIVKELLPFVMLSEGFTQHSIRNSKGSVNPYINWKDIANYEFLLPPKDQQAKLAELLWAADAQLQAALELSSRLGRLYDTRREALCFGDDLSKNSVWHRKLKRDVSSEPKFARLGEHLADIRYGTSKKSNSDGKGIQCVGIPHVLDENLNSDGAAFVELAVKEQELITLLANDILIVRTNGNPAYTGRSALVPSDTDLVFASYLIRIRIDERDFEPEFLIRYLQTQTIRRFFKRHATSSAGNYNINTEDIKGVPVPRIPLQEQARVAEELASLELQRATAEESSSSSRHLLKSLVNQIF